MYGVNYYIFIRSEARSPKPEVTSVFRLPSSNFLPKFVFYLLLKLILCYFFTSLTLSSFSQQNKIDSLLTLLKTDKEDTNKVNQLLEIGDELRKNNPDTALFFTTQALRLSENITQNTREGSDLWVTGKIGMARSNYQMGMAYTMKGNYIQSLEKYNNGLGLLESLDMKVSESKKPKIKIIESNIIAKIGNVYKDQANYPKALEYYLRALKIAEDLKNENSIAANLGNVGFVYWRQKNYAKALDYLFRALKIAEEQGNKNKEGVSRHLGNIGNIYFEQGDYPKALENYFKALKIAEELGSKYVVGWLGNIGDVYATQGDYPKALDYYYQGLAIAEKLGNKAKIAENLGDIGTTYAYLKRYAEAEKYLLKAITLCDNVGLLDKKMFLEEVISNLYNTTGNFNLAYEHYKNYAVIKDSIFNMEKDKDITRKELNYEFEKKEEASKAENEKQIAVAAARKKKQAIQLWSVMGGMLLLSLILIIVVRSLKIARKQKNIIEEQKEISLNQKNTVEEQKQVIEKKQKEILNSIYYARRIQKAIITSNTYIKQYLNKEYFILFKPKDIVSGDFYWAIQHHNKFYMITADSTGHGVPGAFMSLLNISFLNEAIVERGFAQPHHILNYVREEIIKALNPEGSERDSRDGMDAILCCYDFENMLLHFAAANNPLWLLREGEIIEYKADKMPVGKYTAEMTSFTLQTIALQKGDIVYTITDGYADQFGGQGNKKLGKKTLRSKLSANSLKSMPEQKDILLNTFNDWKAGQEQIDDVSVMGVKI